MASARSEVNALASQLTALVAKLEDVSNGLRTDFSGIGNERCAQSIDSAIKDCRSVISKLKNMNMTKKTASWLLAHPESTEGSSEGGHTTGGGRHA